MSNKVFKYEHNFITEHCTVELGGLEFNLHDGCKMTANILCIGDYIGPTDVLDMMKKAVPQPGTKF
jgi:hypothetical protein